MWREYVINCHLSGYNIATLWQMITHLDIAILSLREIPRYEEILAEAFPKVSDGYDCWS